jgi:hypothetical protein
MNAIEKGTDNLLTAGESKKMSELVSGFKTAESILEMGRIAFEAHQISYGFYTLFCERVMARGKSMMSKLVAIGRRYDDFYPHKNNLPSQWTTLYNLTQLANDEFAQKCETGEIHSKLTGKESLILIGKAPSKRILSAPSAVNQVDNSFDGLGVFISCESAEMAHHLKDIIQTAINVGLKARRTNDYELYEETSNESLVEAVNV